MKKVVLLSIFSLFFISCMNYVPEQNTKTTMLSQPEIQQTEPEEGQQTGTEQQITKDIVIQNVSTTLIARRFTIRYKTSTEDIKTKTIKIQDVGPGTTEEIDMDFSIPEDCTMTSISIDMNVVDFPENGWFAKNLDLDLLLDKTRRKTIKIMGDKKSIKIEMTETE